MIIQELLENTVKNNASDLHLSTGEKPVIRVDGDLHMLEKMDVVAEDLLAKELVSISPPDIAKELGNELDIDFGIGLSDIGRFRVNVFRQARGLSATFRTIPFRIPNLEELKTPKVLYDLCKLPHGLILVTGPTGSGKSTTLAAMIDNINQNNSKHIITVEDPIEYLHTSKKCLVQQREVHRHTNSFQIALRAALREDPDYILVGEMRDIETIRLALTAAETGHLVLATLHTNSAPATINRIVDVFPMAEKEMVRTMLAESLQAVVAQRLVKKREGGRVAAFEVMKCTPAVCNMIRENKVQQIYSSIQTGHKVGMQTMEQHLRELVDGNVIDSSYIDNGLKLKQNESGNLDE